MKYNCPCCGHLTMDAPTPGSREICPVCFWQDDKSQFLDPMYEGGANKISLTAAKKNYFLFGACEEAVLSKVRPPLADEVCEEK